LNGARKAVDLIQARVRLEASECTNVSDLLGEEIQEIVAEVGNAITVRKLVTLPESADLDADLDPFNEESNYYFYY